MSVYQSDEIRDAFVTLRDGERVPCLLEKVGPNEWQATPARKIGLDEIETCSVDVLAPGTSVSFLIEGVET